MTDHNQALRDALEMYGSHKFFCEISDEEGCVCGFTDRMNALAMQEPASEPCKACDGTGVDVYDGNPDRDCQVCYGRKVQPKCGELREATPESELAAKILAELTRARAKFPGKNVTFAALVEEVGELATATFEESAERVEKEAVQVAVMAMRMVLDGDHCFNEWREGKGLDPLDPVARDATAPRSGESK